MRRVIGTTSVLWNFRLTSHAICTANLERNAEQIGDQAEIGPETRTAIKSPRLEQNTNEGSHWSSIPFSVLKS